MTGTAYWEHYAHEADIGIRGVATSKEAAFAQAAQALTAVITDPDTVHARTAIDVHCQAPDDELLLYDWLNAIIYQMATRHMLFSRFDIRIEDHQLAATLHGEAIDLQRHHPTVEIKGATLTTLHVGKNRDGLWQAQCVVDV